ncbi:MAG: ABC transporter permease [Propionibacteriales bacterium]|nr:ABC transporter permease [Propionibacteriales bacterium]
MQLAPRLGQYWVTVYKRTWRGSVVSSFVMPLLYLSAMGVGLGSFVDDTSGPTTLGGVSYLAFIAPGLLATTAMQTAVGESTYPVMGGFKWDRTYVSMAASPLEPSDILLAHLAMVAFRILTTCSVFLLVLAAFGALTTWWGGPVALGVSVLLGMAHAAPLFALSSRLDEPSAFSLVYRVGLMPMFLFSGAFFPISQLPPAVAWLAYATPIWHGVDLSRMLTLDTVRVLPALGHIAYLLLWLGAGWFLARRAFADRLAT